jgi:FMN phosphatase YigB (HAD superfamily)
MPSSESQTAPAEVAFLLDVDNTLVDTDRAKRDLDIQVEQLVGPERAAHFWELYEAVRRELDCVNVPQTLRRFQARFPDEQRVPQLFALLLQYPFENWLYPGALDTIAHLRSLGAVAIVSDGDPIFQPAKIARAGLADAVDDRVFIFRHKEEHLEEVMRLLPARRYVLVDDKPRILAAAKARLRNRLFTLHVRQGAYARAAARDGYPPADRDLATIADLAALGPADFGGSVNHEG